MRLLSSLLNKLIHTGSLTVTDFRGRSHQFGNGGDPRVAMRLHTRGVALKLVLNPPLYIGESYMDGTMTPEGCDLYALLDFLLMNVGIQVADRAMQLPAPIDWFLRHGAQLNPISRSRKNVAHHYDLSNDLYRTFLDADMQYSCAYFRRADNTLEEAQQNKKAHIAAKLCLEPGQRVLDIGCGWGGMALYLNKAHGVHVTGLTLSKEQAALARERAVTAGVDGEVEFRLQDYRETEEQFDRIVSIGMFEHVGTPQYGRFFEELRHRLNPEGIALLHTIGRSEGPGATSPWLRKYIFPGGYSPSLSETVAAIEKAGLVITDIEVLRLHYAKTIHHWRQRFAAAREQLRETYDERFCRMFEFYLDSSEVSFIHGGHVVFQIQITRKQDAVPLTRDYLAGS